jgi:NADH-quinone oxidoreductase subunit A
LLANYFPILLFLAIGTAVGVGAIVVSGALARLSGSQNPDSEKLSPYECGFDVRYYLVAILFILFDLEIAFLFPWAIVLQDIGWFGLISMLIFLGILVVGFIYEWKKGALEWE